MNESATLRGMKALIAAVFLVSLAPLCAHAGDTGGTPCPAFMQSMAAIEQTLDARDAHVSEQNWREQNWDAANWRDQAARMEGLNTRVIDSHSDAGAHDMSMITPASGGDTAAAAPAAPQDWRAQMKRQAEIDKVAKQKTAKKKKNRKDASSGKATRKTAKKDRGTKTAALDQQSQESWAMRLPAGDAAAARATHRWPSSGAGYQPRSYASQYYMPRAGARSRANPDLF